MIGQMMRQPLIISSLIDHAARYHGNTEVVSVETSGEVTRTYWSGVALRARKLASALGKMGLTQSDHCATIAWAELSTISATLEGVQNFVCPGLGGYYCGSLLSQKVKKWS